jgi:hypothetical protein
VDVEENELVRLRRQAGLARELHRVRRRGPDRRGRDGQEGDEADHRISIRQNPGVSEIVRRDELQAAVEARNELGADMEPALVDSFVERIEQRLAERTEESERSLKRKREHQKEMVLGAMGISVPLLAIAAIFTGLAGVIVVCAALAVIAVVSSR